ncbi:hypothetical protein [Herbiconiux sp. YIM B11900]|uniref:hypothetical protein n=1 Tax=Herbiconiux sp. YIM B11900 TaxID=3404131 RepID=UPI003F863971
MTSTRDRLETRGARSRRLRIAAIVSASLVLVLGAAALSALWWLPPVLAETPRERLLTDTAIVLTPAATTPPPTPTPAPTGGSAAANSVTVLAEAGWVVVGVGPFLPADRAVLLSPDGVLRVETIALHVSPAVGAVTADDVAPIAAPTDADQAALAAVLAGSGAAGDGEQPDLAAAAWSAETLASGATVRYAELATGAEITLVALLHPAVVPPAVGTATTTDTTQPGTATATGTATTTDTSQPGTATPAGTATATDTATAAGTATPTAQPGTALVLLATAPADRAADYRPTIADILTTTTFAASAPTPQPDPLPEPTP